MRKLIFLFLIIGFTQNNVSAQRLEVKRGSKVELNGNVYDFYESEEIFKEVPVAYQPYLSSKKAKKAAKGW